MSARRARSWSAGAGLAALLLVGGCDAVSTPVVGEPSPEPVQKAVDARCTDPPAELVALVAERLTVEAELQYPKLVASEERPDVHFLSAKVAGPELASTPPVGTWVVRGPLDAAEPAVAAVGAVASEYSDWPDGTRGDDPVVLTDDGGKEALACVESAAG